MLKDRLGGHIVKGNVDVMTNSVISMKTGIKISIVVPGISAQDMTSTAKLYIKPIPA